MTTGDSHIDSPSQHRLSDQVLANTLERPLLGKPGMGVEEPHLAAVVRIHEHRQHLAAKQARQHVDMHEEVGARGEPLSTPVEF
jgi:hypothetical protein